MAQPQPRLLAQHLRGAADQCELLGNLPAINDAQSLQLIMTALGELRTQMTTL